MAKRKTITKKTRFEVFKRDGFKCVYCGKTPPKVVLEVDHIVPVSNGGENEIGNYVTACFDCNRGKSNVPLDKIPQSMNEDLDELKEKESQINEYRKFVKKVKKRSQKDVSSVEKIFKDTFTDKILSENFKRTSVKKFLNELPLDKVEDAMHIACDRKDDPEIAVKYFCGICWNMIKGDH